MPHGHGWHHESGRHALAARGVKTRKVFYFPDEPEVYGDYDEQDYELVEEDLERMGYYSPDDWYRGSGTSIVITNPRMLKDGRILRLFKRYGVRRE